MSILSKVTGQCSMLSCPVDLFYIIVYKINITTFYANKLHHNKQSATN